ncbi:alpha-1,2-fucosyltransferase [Lachnospiraceae bacterium JLR.KK008]
MKKVIIFGAGLWGDLAYHYYNTQCEIAAYVDNNENLWNTKRNGIEVLSPEILRNTDAVVIVATMRYVDQIKQQLINDYGVTCVIIFRISEEIEELDEIPSEEDELIVTFRSGLGNQMFQYAVYKMMEVKGKKVRADLSHYYGINKRNFDLTKVFPKIRLQKASGYKARQYKAIGPFMDGVTTQVYFEPNVKDRIKSFADPRLLKGEMEFGYLQGYFQTSVFPSIVEKELRKEFVFSNTDDKGLKKLSESLCNKNVVSVHIRRGDYLHNQRMYGGICTGDYYKRAIELICDKVKSPVFCFFSNDIEWVKKNYNEKETIYVEENMFDEYHDWYDMYLMSLCKHNIIANSSFSWWGAWLNQNQDKMVIAPQKWVNVNSMEDICPEEWIRM